MELKLGTWAALAGLINRQVDWKTNQVISVCLRQMNSTALYEPFSSLTSLLKPCVSHLVKIEPLNHLGLLVMVRTTSCGGDYPHTNRNSFAWGFLIFWWYCSLARTLTQTSIELVFNILTLINRQARKVGGFCRVINIVLICVCVARKTKARAITLWFGKYWGSS